MGVTAWETLPGMDSRGPFPRRDFCDRVVAVHCVFALGVPVDFTHRNNAYELFGKQFKECFDAFLDWLTPRKGDDHTDDMQGYYRRLSLVHAVEKIMTRGANPYHVLNAAELLYFVYLGLPEGRYALEYDRPRRAHQTAA
jgi:hypothetical protein